MTADLDCMALDFGVEQRTPDPGEYFANGSWHTLPTTDKAPRVSMWRRIASKLYGKA